MSHEGDPTCPGCGYCLRALPDAGACPECGLDYDREALSRGDRVPWLGWWTALLPPVAYAGCLPLIAFLKVPMSYVVTFFFIAWCLTVNRRVAGWAHNVRMQRSAQGEGPRPSPVYRRNLVRVLLILDCVVLLGLWFAATSLADSRR